MTEQTIPFSSDLHSSDYFWHCMFHRSVQDLNICSTTEKLQFVIKLFYLWNVSLCELFKL